jgi:hypothetical protein
MLMNDITRNAQRRTMPNSQDFGLKISPSTVLQNLLRHYPSGGQFISKALQNAEDTNSATMFCTILDLRKQACNSLKKSGAGWTAKLQGEAIEFYDNGNFKDEKGISTEHLQESPSQAGAFGMGSRSFFHIGDVIQIVSGSKYGSWPWIAGMCCDDRCC